MSVWLIAVQLTVAGQLAVVVASGHVSDPALESTRRRLTAKQADTVDRLGRAAVELLSREGFAGLTVRRVAAEAGVGAATAYTYFSSKEHLVAEVFWRRLAGSPPAAHDSDDRPTRVIDVLRHIALLVADEPEFAGAVTNALLGRDPDVEVLRLRIGRDIHDRLAAALGLDTDPGRDRVAGDAVRRRAGAGRNGLRVVRGHRRSGWRSPRG